MATIEQEKVTTSTADHQRVTREELLAELDERARSELGLSAADFMERLHAGELDPESPAIVELAFLARIIERASRTHAERQHRWRFWLLGHRRR